MDSGLLVLFACRSIRAGSLPLTKALLSCLYLNVRMFSKDCLPLIDLAIKQNSTLRHALLKYGAFRLRAPEVKKAFAQGVLHNVGHFVLMCEYFEFKFTSSRRGTFFGFQTKRNTERRDTQLLARSLFVETP